jgi:WD40 repeat protein
MTKLFISYARGDDGEPFDPVTSFVARLHADLTSAGIDVWFDRVSLPSRQLTFHQEIADAIRARDRLILVVGPQAATSDYVRQEWRWALELDKPVIPILRRGDYEHVPGELGLLHCDDFRDDAQYPAQLAKLIGNLQRPAPPLGALFGVPSLPLHFLGRPELLRRVKDALLVDLQKPVVITGEAARVGMQGMGGIGKSVLAAALARDPEVRRSYPDGIVWVAFGQQPDRVSLQRDVARHLGSTELFDTEMQGLGVLRQLLAQKAVLLVLDDVWTARDAQAFDALGPRCRALITTRDAGILHSLHGQSVPVALFTEAEALQLLAGAVGVQRADLPLAAREVVTECGCLPLAVALCGGMAKKRAGDWGTILQRLRRADLEKIADREAINEQHRSIWRAMQVSVNVLAPEHQRRFAELAVFAAGGLVPEAAVRTLWAHTGNLDDFDTTALLIELSERSLIQLDQKTATSGEGVERRFRLHDLLYDYATRIAGDPVPLHDQMLDAYRKLCRDGWPGGPNDGYFFQNLLEHMLKAGHSAAAVELLQDLPWLEAKTQAGLIFDLPRDFGATISGLPDTEPQRRILRLLEEAILQNIRFIAQHRDDYPQALFQCLWNSGWWYGRLDAADWYECRFEEKNKDSLVSHSMRAMQSCRSWLWRRLGIRDASRRSRSDLQRVLERWRAERGARRGRFAWFRSLLPPPFELECGINYVIPAPCGTVVTFSPDGAQIAAVDEERDSLVVWRVDTLESEKVDIDHMQIDCVAFSEEGRRIVTGSTDGTVRLWNLDECRAHSVMLALTPSLGHLARMAISANGRLVVGVSYDGTVAVWQLGPAHLTRVASHELAETITAAAVSADGSQLAFASADGGIRLARLDRPEFSPRHLRGRLRDVTCVALSPDGHRVGATSKDGTACVWCLDRPDSEPSVWRAHLDWATCIAFSPDNHSVASASCDRSVRVWSLDRLEQQVRPLEHSRIYSTLRVSAWPDGRGGPGSVVRAVVTVSDQPGGPLTEIRPLSKGFSALGQTGVSVPESPYRAFSEYFCGFDFVRPRDRIWLGRSGREVFILKLEEDGL